MMSLLVVAAIVVAVALGYKTKINIGLFAIAFAYLIGCFGMGLSPSEVISMWPLKIFFIIFAVCLFYSFATVNGTLEKLAEHLIYRCRTMPQLLPFAVFFTATVISAMGAGYYTVLAFMAPITLLLCERTGMSLITGGMAVNYGALSGANFVSSQSGIIFRGLMVNAGIPENEAFINAAAIFVSTLVVPLVVISMLVFFTGHGKAMKATAYVAAEPTPLNSEQKITLWLTLTMMAIVLAAPITQIAFPDNATVSFINSKMDIGLIASLFSVIALLLKLGDERKAMASVPWATLIMICGVGMLISVAIKAGTIDLLASWMGNSIPPIMVPIVFGIVAAFMSLFSSTLGVVTPALFPMVPPIAAALGVDPMVLFVAIVVGAQATSISPFSSGGSLILGSCPTGQSRTSLFPQLLFRAAPLGFVAALVFNALLTFVY
ncbi:MAG TPA: C4-dicarboxylate ABC transporter [Pseudomonas sp.]|mgnify:FL=1|jgi:di/tricarboxylate transporter|uniref:SLC13 family permease n=1 Tax=Stutzerimonas xanthomarina TaxID=271420 RepID=UPI000E8F74B7|nr:SLC13 family permease [Stutzerimonas xanthomarina]MBU0812329.1 SLC13 family permease [Gammaproteobacteria bacterium]HAQ86896.1 C4-dicarboxylate ABC transporter [Pseudomonas sp.]MBK3848276.1 SLC13 family permease [Stutzerimonas xanthomarina]MBU0852881.1 SLC13 family permease [Gammaproteobacteria bacterium]MBU1302026.1 SLC13 family permease [Gammaproteobacteria bacterium]|tara:strand:+ start:3269 stop:4570 length:1302 start_codon:yes stop_codon:yes gene_type:complete